MKDGGPSDFPPYVHFSPVGNGGKNEYELISDKEKQKQNNHSQNQLVIPGSEKECRVKHSIKLKEKKTEKSTKNYKINTK